MADNIIIAILYLFSFFFYIIKEIKFIKRENTIRLISTFRLMYSFVNGLLPFMILLAIENNSSSVLTNSMKNSSSITGLVLWAISIVEYNLITYAYNRTRASKSFYYRPNYSENIVIRAVLIGLVLGLVSLNLWTSAFGSINGMIINANLVRSRASDIYNPWAFLEHVARIFTILYFVSFALFLKARYEKKTCFFRLLLTLFSLFGALTVMLCTDSRGEIGIITVVTVLYYFVFYRQSSNNNILKSLSKVGILMIAAFAMIIASDQIMNTYRDIALDVEDDHNFIDTIIKEFGFTFRSQRMALTNTLENPFSFMFYNDFTNAILRWIPSRFFWFELPQDIWDYNTLSLQKAESFYGQTPSDFISTSLYSFGLMGIFLQPLYFGFLLKKLETMFRKQYTALFHNAVYGYLFFFSIWWAGFFSLASTSLSFFGTFVVYVIIRIFSKKVKQ